MATCVPIYGAYSIKHHTTIPYSKEENGVVERENKEVNRHTEHFVRLVSRKKLVTVTVYDGTGT